MKTKLSVSRNLLCLFVTSSLFPLISGVAHASVFNNGAGTLEYTTSTNWGTGGVPSSSGFPNGNKTAAIDTYHVISNGNVTNTGTEGRLLLARFSPNNASLTIQSGTLTFGGNDFSRANYIGVEGGAGALTLNGGNFVSTTGALYIAGNPTTATTGVLNVYSGSSLTLQHATSGNLNLAVNGSTGNAPGESTATLNLHGGTVSIAGTLRAGYTGQGISYLNIDSGASLSTAQTNFGASADGVTNLNLTVDAANWQTIQFGALTKGTGAINISITLTGSASDYAGLTNDELVLWNTTSGNLSGTSVTLGPIINNVAGLDGTFDLSTGTFTVTAIPEPSTYFLSALSLGGLTLFLTRRRSIR